MTQLGFSLLEVMVSIGILAGMSLLIYGLSNGMLSGKNRADSAMSMQHMAGVAIEKIVQDLNQAFLAAPAFEGEHFKTGFKGNATELSFSSFAHYHYIKDAKDTDQVNVGYFLEKNESGTEDLWRRESNFLQEKIEEGGIPVVLIENVQELKFEYYDMVKEDWVEEWDTQSISSGRKLPRAVRVTMTVLDPTQLDSREKPKKYEYQTVAEIPLYANDITF